MNHYLGLDVGGTNLVAGVVDEQGVLINHMTIPTGANRGVKEIVEDMVRVSEKAVEQSGLVLSDIASWGIGMPSCVNPSTRLLVNANCFGWKNLPIYEYLENRLPLPVIIENDANCAALGELYAGGAKGYRNVIMLTLGTGLGSGIILNGKIYAGADGMGAELGHTKLVYQGIPCTCGQKGCAESYCSATALIRHARHVLEKERNSVLWDYCRGNPKLLDGEIIFRAFSQQDKVAEKIVEQYVDYLSCAISSFITIFRPEIILLGGGIAKAGKLLTEPLQKRIKRNTFAADEIGIPEVRAAELGNNAGIIGSAMLGKTLNKERRNEENEKKRFVENSKGRTYRILSGAEG